MNEHLNENKSLRSIKTAITKLTKLIAAEHFYCISCDILKQIVRSVCFSNVLKVAFSAIWANLNRLQSIFDCIGVLVTFLLTLCVNSSVHKTI